jgi:ligand-binding sensor domain-containing protein
LFFFTKEKISFIVGNARRLTTSINKSVMSEKMNSKFPSNRYIVSLILLCSLVFMAHAQEKPVKGNAQNVTFVTKSFGDGLSFKNFRRVAVDDDNIKWFLTEAGIVSYDGMTWVLHNKNRKVPSEGLKDVAYDFSSYGREIWLATPTGATVASLPVDARTGATTYYSENSTIASDNVLAVAIGKSPLRWFGTDKGVSAFYNRKWLKSAYLRKYPASIFTDYPITAMAATNDGDSVYVATEGAGVARLYRDKADAISGASEYAQWGPIDLPSDKVYCICIAPDGTQWFGTDMGAARHKGYKTLEGWTVFNKEKGLADNFVQAMTIDTEGNVWFGTKGGISVLKGTEWRSFTAKDGLLSNNILSLCTDRKGTVWIGTDSGVMSYSNGEFVSFR